MSFKDDLIKKIKIDKLAKKALASIGPPDSGRKVDKEALRTILTMASYTMKKERDLELFLSPSDSDKKKILVLDNELAIYNTSIKDVVLRKSPNVKEMLNIKNVFKILNDSDVLVSKREDSVKAVQAESIDKLDLSFNKSDINQIAEEGIASLKKEDTHTVLETLSLFSEILGYIQLPQNVLGITHGRILGALTRDKSGDVSYAPLVIYEIVDNAVKLIDMRFMIKDKKQAELIRDIAAGKKPATLEGDDVFICLAKYCNALDKLLMFNKNQ